MDILLYRMERKNPLRLWETTSAGRWREDTCARTTFFCGVPMGKNERLETERLFHWTAAEDLKITTSAYCAFCWYKANTTVLFALMKRTQPRFLLVWNGHSSTFCWYETNTTALFDGIMVKTSNSEKTVARSGEWTVRRVQTDTQDVFRERKSRWVREWTEVDPDFQNWQPLGR